MALLNELFARLGPEELEIVSGSGLSETEQKLYDFVIAHKGQEPPYNELGFSDIHLRKLQSVLYDKAIHALRPRSDEDRLTLLSEKLLFHHTTHWVVKVEKRLKKANDLDGLKALYCRAARLLPNGEISGFNIKHMDRIVERFQELFPDDLVNLQLIKLHKIHMQVTILREAPGKNLNLDIPTVIQEVRAVARELDDPLVWFWTYFTDMHASAFLEDVDFTELRSRVDQLMTKHGDVIPKDDYVYFLVNQADASYMESHFKEAYDSLNLLYNRYPDILNSKIYWADVYSQICIKLGLLDEAIETQLRAHKVTLRPSDNVSREHFSPYAYLALIHLIKDDFDAAFECIQHVQREISKAHFFWLDAMNKILENTYFHLTGDFSLSDDLAGKHIKFYNYHKDKPDTQIFKDFHNIIRFCARQVNPGATLPDAYMPSYTAWQNGDLAFIGQLLPKVLIYSKVDLPNIT